MVSRASAALLAALMAALFPIMAAAQSGSKPDENAPPQVAPAPKSPPANDGKEGDSATEPPKDPIAKLGEATPSTSEERDRLLTNLYALLATAEGEEPANRIAGAIERLWSFSGSDTVQLLMDRANKALKEKNTALAIRFLNSAVELAPDYAEAWNRRAFVYFSDQSYERALGDLRRALALDPNHFKALEGFGQIMKDFGRKEAALRVLRRLLEVHPYASGVKQAIDELARDVDGQGI